MALNFPSSPILGQIHGDYVWDGEKWVAIGRNDEDGGSVDFATVAAVAGSLIPGSVTYVNVAGYLAAGDGGDALYIKVGYVPAHAGKIQSADGAWWEIVGNQLSTAQFGADSTGATDCSAAVIAALQAVFAKGGGTLVIPPGAYRVGATIDPGIVSADLLLEFMPGAELVAAPGLAVPVLSLRASDSTPTARVCRIIGAHIDCSAGSSPGGGQFCTAINTQFFDQVIITGFHLYGGEEPNNVNADSGITTVGNHITCVFDGAMRGWNDAGIYVNGDNVAGVDPSEGLTVSIDNVVFERCNQAVSAKRELSLVRITNSLVSECTSGIIPSEILTPVYTGPARNMEVIGCRFSKVASQAVRFRGGMRGQFLNNIVEDWGYKYDGTGSLGANAYALVIQGTTGVTVKGNAFSLKSWTRVDHRAVLLENVTLDSVLYTQGGHHFAGNTYRGIARIIVETGTGTPSLYVDEVHDDISSTKFNSLNALSFVKYTNVGEIGSRTYIGGSDYVDSRKPIVASPAGQVLTAANSCGVFTNAGAGARADFTLPDCAKDLKYTFICMDTDGIRLIAVGADQIRVAGVASVPAGVVDGVTVGTSITIEGLDGTNWVATAITGTWTPT